MTQDIKTHIADEAKRIVSGARRSAYGTPENNFTRIAIMWNAYFFAKGYNVVIEVSDISPMMRLMKEARILESPDHYDSHIDLIGYTLTGAEVNGVIAADSRSAQPSASTDQMTSTSTVARQDDD